MSKPIKITHIIYRLAMGGMENGLVNLINLMDTRFEHQIISLTDVTDFAQRITNSKVKIDALAKQPGKDPLFYARLLSTLRVFKPDIVHTRNFGTVDCGVIAKLSGARSLVHGEHGWDMADIDGSNKKYVLLRKFLSPITKKYVAVSKDIRNWLVHSVGIPSAKLVQIYNGVDTNKFYTRTSDSRDELHIGFVGRLEEVKHPQLLIDAAHILAGRDDLNRAIKLTMIGSGSLSDKLQQSVRRNNLQDSVTLPGASNDIAQLMRSFDVFVLPSLNEGISNTILEAMSSGLPVVAARVGGNPELVVDGVNGMLYDNNDAQALTEALVGYVNDEQLRMRHGKASRKRVEEKFSLTKMVDAYEDMYQSCIS